jgi:hypothetical protein
MDVAPAGSRVRVALLSSRGKGEDQSRIGLRLIPSTKLGYMKCHFVETRRPMTHPVCMCAARCIRTRLNAYEDAIRAKSTQTLRTRG